MWVVKIGGSLHRDALLPQWLQLLAQLGGGRVTLVCGGGPFAHAVRQAQWHWRFNDEAAHNMALLAMAQTAYQLHALNPALQLTSREADIRRVLRAGRTALWLPLELPRAQAADDANRSLSSDSVAWHLARRLNAERLVLVKSDAIDPALGEAGDSGFAALSQDAAFPIDVLHKNHLARMRSLLLGASNAPGHPG